MVHIPVLKKEVLKYLDPKPNENFIDATIGEGGYAKEILERIQPEGKLLGIEWDAHQIKNCRENLKEFKERLILVNDSYVNITEIVKEFFLPADGVLFDLGMSRWHIECSKRGFSFQREEPLDMRYSTKDNSLTAEKIVNEFSEEELVRILKEYGEERFARRIAENIVKARKNKRLKTTFQLVEIIEKSIPSRFRRGRIHCATKTFQALRIAVNDELNNLRKTLPQLLNVLKKGGRIVIISFHSLEDRLVKNFLKVGEKNKILKIKTKKPVRPTLEELKDNLSCKSAKLRACIKL